MVTKPVTLRYLLTDKRARVYLLWAALTTVGFALTHLHQLPDVTLRWLPLVAIGIGYMFYAMPLKYSRMRQIIAIWSVVIAIGLLVSWLVFVFPPLYTLIGYLGVVWLLIMAAGYALNGVVDAPSEWYWVATALNVLAAFTILFVSDLLIVQYLIAAVVSGVSLGLLWLFRSPYE